MKVNRIWAMPNKWTFTIKPIKELLSRWVIPGDFWCDPFAGENSPAQTRNDLSGKVEFNMDALEFLKSLDAESYDGVLLDPPYSITQAKQCYEGRGMELLKIKPTSMKYWAEVKNEIKRILKPGGVAICFGWTSMGLGKNRGFVMDEILLVPHGGSKNDTIVTVERKLLIN
jgi:DNA modification methylase